MLDTTGSMGGLIAGAKIKIWAIANQIISAKPKPHLKIALLPYRDRGDEYVTKVFDLTDDLDTVFKNLQGFAAQGGGDEPESVNQALDEAVHKVTWSADRKVTKIIFLVGDAPPHMDYKDDKKYPDVCKEAVKKDLIINAVQCGNIPATTPIWQEIAKLSEGSYLALPQEGGMVAISTPVDAELVKLNDELNKTVALYGDRAQQQGAADKVLLNSSSAGGITFAGGTIVSASAPTTRPAAEALVSRLSYNAADGGKVVQGRGDLLYDLKEGTVTLDSLKPEELPPALQKMTPQERKAWIDGQQRKRSEIQAKITELNRKRDEFVRTETKRLAETSKDPTSGFDAKVAEIVREEAARSK